MNYLFVGNIAKIFIVFSFSVFMFGCNAAKYDYDSYEKAALKSVIRGDYEKAEYNYNEKLKIARFMKWRGSEIFAMADVANMRILRKDVVGAEEMYQEALAICKSRKELSKESIFRIYEDYFFFLLTDKKDTLLLDKFVEDVIEEKNQFSSHDEKKELLFKFSENLKIFGIKSLGSESYINKLNQRLILYQ
jgi:hypothetical protein